ncbi:MAG: hypothetical protein ACKOQY_11020 [Bacteroidota bacterium]
MEKKTFLTILALVVAANGCLVLHAFAPKHIGHARSAPVEIGDAGFKTGDLVFRRGYGLVSELLRKSGRREQRFSHAGIVWMEQGRTYVLHMAAEPESGLNRCSISDFVAPDVAFESAVYRLPLSPDMQFKLLELLSHEQQISRPFDEAFALGNGEAQYCTEWLAGLLTRSGYTMNLPVDFVAPDDIYLQSGSRRVCTFDER